MSKFDISNCNQSNNHVISNQSYTRILSFKYLDKLHPDINIFDLDLKAIQIFSGAIIKILRESKMKSKRNIQITKVLLNYKKKSSKIIEKNTKALVTFWKNNYNFYWENIFDSFIKYFASFFDLVSKNEESSLIDEDSQLMRKKDSNLMNELNEYINRKTQIFYGYDFGSLILEETQKYSVEEHPLINIMDEFYENKLDNIDESEENDSTIKIFFQEILADENAS